MKKISYATIVLLLLIIFGCKKECVPVTVVRDCTGTYLRFNSKDYHVCNPEKISAFENGEKLTATFKKIRECNGSAIDTIVCLMMHENEGWIEIGKIN